MTDRRGLFIVSALAVMCVQAAAQELPADITPPAEPPMVSGAQERILGTSEAPLFEQTPVKARQAGEALPFAAAAPASLGMRRAPSLLSLPPLPKDVFAQPASTQDLQGQPREGMLGVAGDEQTALEARWDGFSEDLAEGTSSEASPVSPLVIQTQQLSSQDVASIGLLSEAESGFSTQIWQRSRVQNLLLAWDSAPVGARSPAIQETLRVLAIAVASAPPLSDTKAWDLLEKRIKALTQIGALGDAATLLARVPDDLAPGAILRQKAEIALWAQDWPTACGAARIGLDRSADAYWTNVTLACRAVSGNRPAVMLLLDVLGPREQPTQIFMAAINAVLEVAEASSNANAAPLKRPDIDVDQADALSYALAAQLGLEPAPDMTFLDQSALTHASLAKASLGPLEQRWPGVVALAYNARMQPGSMLQFLAAAPQMTPADNALGVAPGDFLQPLSFSNAVRRVEGLLDLSRMAGLSGLRHFWAPAVGEVLTATEPAPSLWPYAGDIAAHLAFAGQPQAIVRWYAHIRGAAAPGDLEAAQSLISVWPYAVVASDAGDVPFTPRILQLWWDTQNAPDAAERARKAVYLFTALGALGYPVPTELSAAVESEAAQMNAVSADAVDAAELARMAQNGETGRAVLMSLAALGPDGPALPAPKALGAALRTLVEVEQGPLARSLASEALFYAGISQSDDK